MDANAEVRTIQLLCPLCEAQGETARVKTPVTHIWVPDVRDVEKMGEQFSKLIEVMDDGHKRGRGLCSRDGLLVRKAGIRTYQLSQTLARRQERAATTLASILGGEKVDEIKDAVGKAETRRTKAAVRKAGKPEGSEGKGRKPRASSKGRAKDAERREIAEATAGDEPTES